MSSKGQSANAIMVAMAFLTPSTSTQAPMRTPTSVRTLEDFGRVQLSKSFFMREFLYSEISQVERIPNLPRDP